MPTNTQEPKEPIAFEKRGVLDDENEATSKAAAALSPATKPTCGDDVFSKVAEQVADKK